MTLGSPYMFCAVATAPAVIDFVEEFGELVHDRAAKLFGVYDSYCPIIIAGDIMADSDGE